MTGALPSFNQEMKRLGAESLTPQQTRSILSGQVDREVTSFLDDQAGYLEKLNKADVKNSAVNFSLGDSKAAQSERLYFNVLEGLGSDNKQLGDNYARAFGVNMHNMGSSDPEVQRAEDAKLQQSVVDFVSGSVDGSKPIGESRTRWNQAVQRFEGNRNSVVISSGNEGSVEEQLEGFTGNRQLELPRDFEKNFLENDQVTTVGATDTAGLRADYSNESGGVDVYANGTLSSGVEGQEPVNGTSFASPRVGVTMAELHRLNPNFTSSQVEHLLETQLSRPLQNGNSGAAPVLRTDANFDFLREGKY